jgi:nucleolar protein 58
VWLKEFQTFDDKSSAINADTGVNAQLTEMIMKSRKPGEQLLVGKPEYKSIIETCLVRISSLFFYICEQL